MDAVNSTTGLDRFALPRSDQAAGTGSLGQEDFLRLMITQFQNQDPMAPMENGDFLGQMAQFSTVSGIGDMSEAVDSLASSIQASQALQAAQIVGRNVLVASTHGELKVQGNPNNPKGAQASMRGAVEVPGEADNVSVRILNDKGEVMKDLDLGRHPGGLMDFEWDGVTARGEDAPAGVYRLVAEMQRGGQTTGITTLAESRVTSVALGDGGNAATVTTEYGRTLPLTGVRGIRDSGG